MQRQEKNKVKIKAAGARVGIAVARFNRDITGNMLKSALQALARHGVKKQNIKIVHVAGSVELPFALQTLARTGRFDCLVGLGCVVRGETAHFDYVCKTAQEGILRVSLDESIPIGFGVVTADTLAQARARTEFGAHAVSAALELAALKKSIT